ncbi:PREDICTED: granulocyte-macrophage colony-stimulating factor receptor subunit alpha-like [Myotis davidii]|uniref:granulocyte-macrophage colony-stimulating factor receptor subunit alpha-like n=1 Tax=Myotis davidii TaxID=225400 RepID=UPI000767D8C1|nr:PREDICTED: granulocyte-macrophage colony-stimulating factor receptor subunit alpha-like [Myotis davidii]
MPSSSMRAGHTVRARVRFVHSEQWSDWTPILHFGLPDQEVSGFPGALLGMVVGVAALVITVLMFLCTRFSLRRKLFPPVPQVKTEVVGTGEAFPEVAWDRVSRRPSLQEAEEILSVEEVRPLESGQGDPVGPASPQHLSAEGISGPERRPLHV